MKLIMVSSMLVLIFTNLCLLFLSEVMYSTKNLAVCKLIMDM